MSYPTKAERKVCWDSRDKLWECLDSHKVDGNAQNTPKECAALRKLYESSCPSQWVTHFDRKRDYNMFKKKMETEGFEPIKDQMNPKFPETMKGILQRLKASTSELKLENFQETISIVHKLKENSKTQEENILMFAQKASSLIWGHLNVGLSTTECQTIAATTFFTLLTLQQNISVQLNAVSKEVTEFCEAKTNDKLITERKTLLALSLIYGLYQSPFISLVETDYGCIESILQTSFQVLALLAYEYSQFTFLTFKILQSTGKLLQSKFRDILLTEHKQTTLLMITCHNWENPITGIRDMNIFIFDLVLDITAMMETNYTYDKILAEINKFPWNKAKYLMLSEIIVNESKTVPRLFMENVDWLDGLTRSLSSTGLVSAGADMYFSVLKKIKCETEWSDIFLDPLLKILNGEEFKAIENFNNYWCMNTLKCFPDAMDFLTEHLHNFNSYNVLYAHLSIWRQGNKLGLLQPWSSVECDDIITIETRLSLDEGSSFLKTIVCGLEHVNVNIRIQTFEILCLSHNNSLPTKIECHLILKYIKENVNSDSTILRLSMLKNLKLFFDRLHVSMIHMSKHTKKDDVLQKCMAPNILFVYAIEYCIKFNLETKGNYQRNITSIKICELLMSFYKKYVPSYSCGFYEWLMTHTASNNAFCDKDRIFDYLIALLDDSAEDVRETASTILQLHFKYYFSSDYIRKLISGSQKNIHSKFFYKVSSGHSIMKLVANLLTVENCNDLKIELLLHDSYADLKNALCNYDILMALENGSQLHGLISIIKNILEVCLQNMNRNSWEKILPKDILESLVTDLAQIPGYYKSADGVSSSPDFYEMNDMVEDIISRSESTLTLETTGVEISDLHQIVLNCIWLNLKACCDLSSTLVKCITKDDYVQYSEQCLHTMTNVLETSRHKGAIEAAGVALGKSINHLTSMPKNLELSKLPMKLLQERLNEVVNDINKMGSITRRGAGLSIMVHRIVCNDTEKGKPLFHYAIKTLLEACTTAQGQSHVQDINERDNPKAIYIHLMTKIVADSSLASDVMFYSARLAEVAFTNLTSEQWQIRNASLQLYGALVPKLIGQKKSSSIKDDSAATVGCDELRTHSPKLWEYIQDQLDCHSHNKDVVLSHSNLVPILNLLASTAKRYNFSHNARENDSSHRKLFRNLMTLLNSPIYTVRRLTAKCIELMFDFEDICKYILSTKSLTENLLHGFLLLTQLCKQRLCEQKLYEEDFVNLESFFYAILYRSRHSYVVISVYDDIFFSDQEYMHEKVAKTLEVLNREEYTLGVSTWANIVISKCIQNCQYNVLPTIVYLCLNQGDLETYLDLIIKKINNTNIPNEILIEIASILSQSEKKNNFGGIWKILYEISSKYTIKFDTSDLKDYTFLGSNVPYNMRYMIPVHAKLILDGTHNDHSFPDVIVSFSKLIFTLTNNESVDMRYIAALANNVLGNKITLFPLSTREDLVKSAVILLQDDDEDVRMEASHFYSNVMYKQFVFQPFICLQKILNEDFLVQIDINNFRTFLKNLLEQLEEQVENINKERYNPFLMETRNIYAEPNILKSLLEVEIKKQAVPLPFNSPPIFVYYP